MTPYQHCIETVQLLPTVFVVAYVNWLGDWVMDTQEFRTEKSALAHSRVLAKTKAENGRVSVRKVISSKFKRAKLQQNTKR
jgi:hypothetical protein